MAELGRYGRRLARIMLNGDEPERAANPLWWRVGMSELIEAGMVDYIYVGQGENPFYRLTPQARELVKGWDNG